MFEVTNEFIKSRWLIQVNKRLPYNPDLKERAKELRKNITKAEKKIWFDFLKKSDFRFLKQRPIDNFIVDFYCRELNLIIEIDWDSHYENWALEYDSERTNFLEWYGLKVVRFTNLEIYNNFESVCERLDNLFSDLW